MSKFEALMSPKGPKGGQECQDLVLEFVPVCGTAGSLVIKDSLFLSASTTSSIEDCAIRISQQLGSGVNDDWHEVKFSMGDFGTRRVFWSTKYAFAESTQPVSHFLCHERPIIVKHRSGKFHDATVVVVFVKSLTGMVTTVNLPLNPTADDIKIQMHDQEGIPPDQQRLIFAGKQLEDQVPLSFYGIKNECSVQIILRLRGGGGPCFVDVTKAEALRTAAWNIAAPDWRIADKGLTLEGLCQNQNCRAHQKMVIMNLGFRNFDLLSPSDKDTCTCPMCHYRVTPIKPGFNNCLWKISCVKQSDPLSVIHRPWTKAEDKYTTYDEVVAGTTEFTRLQIFVQRLDSCGGQVKQDCAICLEGLSVGHLDKVEHESHCGHHFHPWCAKMWTDAQKCSGTTPSCPLCRSQLLTMSGREAGL